MKKLLIITGGSKGIGLATARRFAEQGYHVINLSRSPIPLDGATQISVDISDPDWVETCCADMLKMLKGAEQIALVHNAGFLKGGRMQDVPAEELARAMQINVIAAVQLNHLVLPAMRTGSSIIYVGSTLGEKAVPGSCSYVTSKHAVVGLMRSTCQDLVGSGIHTACVCPGFTDTEMLRQHVGDDGDVLDSIASGVAFNRLIEPGEIAETLYFCATNPVINGAVIHANLGQIER